ncbi:SDR family oxidoreductase [Paracoccus sulfuroxidans]|uniref:3-oxoacyl-[acyl-carrier protein] reductase n=1 Tax=Paracoccus sulfuroxidans TaxID=384678 RepID=A0A562NH59_9RHOB|nr:SDR family oxidoreductase [Paracoccus sulfuroxidans]TWI31251.1 3-oxoacyl-[acyl-carrier protein] reductase [Paracoccus sulfuroxidans]
METGLNGTRALVTAGARGLGRASALALAAEGARVAVAGRNLDTMSDLADELRGAGASEVLLVRIDLAEPETITAGVRQVVDAFGGLDVLVANTGGPSSGPFLDFDRGAWQSALDETFLPLIDLCHAALPSLRVSGRGRIIFVTTVGVKIVQPNMVLSDSIRLAMVGMAKSLSIEFAEEGVTVNCLCPGPFGTDRMEYLVTSSMERDGLSRTEAEALWLSEVPVGKFGDPKDFGAMVALLASDRGSFITGTAIALDGGKSRAY